MVQVKLKLVTKNKKKTFKKTEETRIRNKYCPDSSVGRAAAFGADCCGSGCGLESWPHHTKGVKNGTSSSLTDARIKGVVCFV